MHRISLAVFTVLSTCSAPPTTPELDPPRASEDLPIAAQYIEKLAPGVWRLSASPGAARDALPSFALKAPVPLGPRAPDAPALRPTFLRDAEGHPGFRLDVEPGTSLYGLGEVPGPLERTGRRAELWNTDAYGYREDAMALYQSHPWVLVVKKDGTSFGVLADTTWRAQVDLRDGVRLTADGPAFPVLVFEGPRPQDVLRKLADWTGHMPMPPRWALGYHQCRYSYMTADRVREVATEFRRRKIPADVIWMDIDYMHAFRVFTFDPERFADPARLNRDLSAKGFHNVWMIDPGIASDRSKFPKEGYPIYSDLIAGGHAVRRGDGRVFVGQVWPGDTVFPDFTDPRTRSWWAELYKPWAANGITGVWNDMNEPAVFGTANRTMPEDVVHRGDPALGGPGTHARFHNVYGMLMAKGTWEGMKAARPAHRPFVLSRAGYLGIQRYAATWTGDNSAQPWDVRASIPMVLNLGLSGQPFSGPDIGGFIGDGTPDLYARWIALGALLPFSRGHTAKGTRDKEPWAYGPEIEDVARQALSRRYRLMPYLYTVFREASLTGVPVARPVFFADPADARLRKEDRAFLLGADLLVVPRLPAPEPAQRARSNRRPLRGPIARPTGPWRRMDPPEDADKPSLKLQAERWVRPGAIIPTGPLTQRAQSPLALTLVVNLDANGTAIGTIYDDAGEGFGYTQGDYVEVEMRAAKKADQVTITLTRRAGDRALPWRTVDVRLLTDDGVATGQGPADGPITVQR